MRKRVEYCYFLCFGNSPADLDSEEFIKASLKHDEITKWAYIHQDKDVYNEHDLKIRELDHSFVWADGFLGQEKYASAKEFIDEKMKMPPYIGDKKDSRWIVLVITEKKLDKKRRKFQVGIFCLAKLAGRVSQASQKAICRA